MPAALPPPSGLLARIEQAGLNASGTPDERWLDGWLVRLNPGKAKRSRCVNALQDGHRPLAERLAAAQALFAKAGLPFSSCASRRSRGQPASMPGWARAASTHSRTRA